MTFDITAALAADPWSHAAYLHGIAARTKHLMSLRNTRSGAVWLLGNGPSLAPLAPAINASPIAKIGVNKAIGLIWPLDFSVLCHVEHLDAAVPPFIDASESTARWRQLEEARRLFIHGTSSPRGLPIQISHHALFSTDLSLGACEGTAATGGSVILVAMQFAYHLGFRTFLLAGCELAGAKMYAGGPFSQAALDGQVRLFKQVAPLLSSLGVATYLVSPGPDCRNEAFPRIEFSDLPSILAPGGTIEGAGEGAGAVPSHEPCDVLSTNDAAEQGR